ncbi:MAG: VWA domain-containing protein [Acidobacteria bacterium]|nr:VWA domain-containing protein [Acidobacteriota bacterium]
MSLRTLLRRIARKLRGGGGESLDAVRVGMLVRAVARNARRSEDPPAAAMLEVLLREVPTAEVEAAIAQLEEQDGATIAALLARMREEPIVPPETQEANPEQVVEPQTFEAQSDDLESILLSGNATLERDLLDRVAAGAFDTAASAQIVKDIVEGSVDSDNRKRALALVKPDKFSKARTIRTLAEIAAWGIERGQELAGRTFRFRLYGTAQGEVGMTYLTGRVIHFNPLPLLRGEMDGRRIVEAIILHEIGHHRYNTGGDWPDIQETAQQEQLGSLLNLVQDEHLERNLRSIDTEWGDSLKILAAWAFQRTSRDFAVAPLLGLLQGASFRVLVRAGLEPSRNRHSVAINSGRLLRELELFGSSYSRFLRALRMGLGNRTGDPKVAEALALFGRAFRTATPHELLEIARELKRIFADELGLADRVGLHGATSPDADELAERLPGVSDNDLQDAIDEMRQAPTQPHSKKEGSGGKTMNRGESVEFAEIEQVIQLPYHPPEYYELAKGVAGWSRRLRRFFETLGLSRITLRRRTAGSAIDRSALQRAVIGGDPRLLMARRTVRRADLFLGVVIDCSGSMQHAESMERAQLFAALIAEAARGVSGIDARFFGFTDDVIYDAGTASQCAVAQLEAEGGNNDAGALHFVAKVAMASRRTAKLVVMISDGMPTECSVEALRTLVKKLTASGLACAQVAVQPIEEVCFPDYVLVDDADLSDAVGRFGRVVAKLVRKTVGG